MFTRIDMLPIYDRHERDRVQSRWEKLENLEAVDRVKELIREGAGEHFPALYWQHGELPILDGDFDLDGIILTAEDIEFPTGDTFKGTSFSYGRFYGCTFRNAHFFNVDFAFSKLHDCNFVGCTFSFASFYGCTFERTRFDSCDFPQHGSFTNSDFHACDLRNCFYRERHFFDCRFDEETIVSLPLAQRPHGNWNNEVRLHNTSVAEVYKGYKEAYRAGEVIRHSRRFFLLERQAVTRHNTKRWNDRLWAYLFEITTGYGLAPPRVALSMVLVFLLFSIIPFVKLGYWNGVLLSAGAFFTFGANADKAGLLGGLGKLLYVIEPFVGVSFVALFVTILARYWFSES
jgi:hypothetical protein